MTARWFGEYSTAPKSTEIDWRPDEPMGIEEARAVIAQGAALLRNPASRFSFVRGGDGALSLFVDGRTYDCTGPAATFAEQLCAQDDLEISTGLMQSAEAVALIVDLVNQGSVAFEPGD